MPDISDNHLDDVTLCNEHVVMIQEPPESIVLVEHNDEPTDTHLRELPESVVLDEHNDEPTDTHLSVYKSF